MARLVKRTATGPYKVDVSAETKFICGCGLSKNQPFCDGTHNKTADRKSTRLNSSHMVQYRMPSSA